MNIKAIVGLFVTGFIVSSSHLVHAQDVLPTFKCQLTNRLEIFNWPGRQIDSFGHNDRRIYFICNSDNAKTGDSIRAVWLADHIERCVPPYETIGVRTFHVVKNRNGGEMIEADLSLSKPLDGWAVGQYHIQVYINDIEGYTYNFVIR